MTRPPLFPCRLSSTANPENGTVSYTYNADGTLATRTDALSQQVRYSYDSHGRVSTVRRYNSSGVEQTCQKVTNTFDGSYNAWGRLSSVSWGGTSCTGGSWSQSYRYTSAGRPTRKTQTGGGFTLTANYTYDNAGKMLTAQYPSSGPTFTYTYDTLARPIKLTDNQATPVDWVKDVLYNASGQITQMKYTQTTSGTSYYTETRSYNILQQMTRITVPGVLDQEYRFADTQNDGRLTQRKDWISGEEVSYQYDSLNRLISASTTGPEWGQSFSYDGFGNMLAQTVTKGTAPTLSVLVDPATNRITTSGYSYDSNGNLTSMPLLTLSYDIENRLVQATSSLNGTEHYVYDPGNQRVWKEGKVYFYGVEGNLLGTYGDGSNTDYNVYFGGKLIWQEAAAGLAAHPVNADRLSSTVKHFPYGEEPTTTTQDRSKFATYYRDATTALDYAQNRYYARTIGRFTSPDPYRASEGPADPQSWNRYAYVQNDPVNFNDPRGLEVIAVGDGRFYVQVTAIADQLMDAMIQMLRFAGNSYRPRLERLPEEAYWAEPTSPALLHVADFSTTSLQAVGVQNSLRWIGAALGLDAECADWLKGSAAVIGTILGEGEGSTQVYVGVGSFSDPGVNAVAGVGGTDLAADSALLTVNQAGAFFSRSAATDSGRIAGGTSAAKVFILLHELAHLTGASGFKEGDTSAEIQRQNNDLVHQHCQATLTRGGVGRIGLGKRR